MGLVAGAALFIWIVSRAGSGRPGLSIGLLAVIVVAGLVLAVVAPKTTGLTTFAGAVGAVLAIVIGAVRADGRVVTVNAVAAVAFTGITVVAGWRLTWRAVPGWPRRRWAAPPGLTEPAPLPASAVPAAAFSAGVAPAAAGVVTDSAEQASLARARMVAARPFPLLAAPVDAYLPAGPPTPGPPAAVDAEWQDRQQASGELVLLEDAMWSAWRVLGEDPRAVEVITALAGELLARSGWAGAQPLGEDVLFAVRTGVAYAQLERGSGQARPGLVHPSIANVLADADQGDLFPRTYPPAQQQVLRCARRAGYFWGRHRDLTVRDVLVGCRTFAS